MSHSAEKWKGGTLWDLLTYILLQNIKKLGGGGLLWDLKKFSKKISHSAEKNWKGGPVGFVGYVKKVKNERGDPFALISADRTWPLMLVVLVVSIVRKVAQSEWDCSLTKKKLATVRVGHFSLEKRRLKIGPSGTHYYFCFNLSLIINKIISGITVRSCLISIQRTNN